MYEDERAKIKTGDPIFFKGNSIASKVIMAASGGDVSHVGMAIETRYGILLCAESTSRNKGQDGVQVNTLRERVRGYDGDVFTKSLIVSRDEDFHRLLEAGLSFMRGRPYEKSKFELALSVYHSPIGKDDFSSIFCSEYYAYFLRLWTWLPVDVPVNSYTPAELCNLIQTERRYLKKQS